MRNQTYFQKFFELVNRGTRLSVISEITLNHTDPLPFELCSNEAFIGYVVIARQGHGPRVLGDKLNLTIFLGQYFFQFNDCFIQC